ncbi:hypothetical protein [Alkalibacterium kapii]|uniref:Uncharacterized protein n=1 Tax=Alkalibacterium kapii TaxID=426704 RepID=A0A511AUJ8_9LACT|nr:hypothetical protein [Alkalibacterium kapii]GEK90771.1 hypothetical protein AKA01nite_03930 [Alkalibacterium kapii]
MFIHQPFYPMILALSYIGITYILVKNEKNYVKYGVTTLLTVLNLSFLYLWLEKVVFLMTSTEISFQTFEKFGRFVDNSYFVLIVPLLLLFAWYGVKKFLQQDHYLLLKSLVIIFYIGALIGVLILGQLVFSLLYYGFAP